MDVYVECAKVIHDYPRTASIKSLVFRSVCKNKGQLMALASETLKYMSLLDEILQQSQLLSIEKMLKKPLVYPLLYDLLFGKGINKHLSNVKLCKVLYRNKVMLHATLARLKVKKGVSCNEDLLPASSKKTDIPRYVRVNTLKTCMSDIVSVLEREGFNQIVMEGDIAYDRYIELLRSLPPKQFIADIHVDNLLVFRHGTDFHNHNLYLKGHIILQDKASCLPAMLLAPPPSCHVIDACAAPGNKSTHLAAIMNNKGKILAVDRAEDRLQTMSKLTKVAGATCIQVKHDNFLNISPTSTEYKGTEYILLDPSCSGSGIVNRVEVDSNEQLTDRLGRLAAFQLQLLSHALSFPNVKRVVYSTCSVHKAENEEVVEEAMAKYRTEFSLEDLMPSWIERGKSELRKCLRASAEVSLTNGFFVALFTRNKEKLPNNVQASKKLRKKSKVKRLRRK